jgi:hypothetical protein
MFILALKKLEEPPLGARILRAFQILKQSKILRGAKDKDHF